MPIPLLLYGGIAVAAAAAALTAAVLTHPPSKEKLVKMLGYKRVAVLGERGVGKSHLLHFFATKTVSLTPPSKTSKPEKIESQRLSLDDLHLKFTKTLDLPGDRDFRGEWKKLYDESDLVLYLVRADRLFFNDKVTEVRAKEDLQQMAMWKAEAEASNRAAPRLFIIGTFCDKDPAFNELDVHNHADYADTFRKLPSIETLIRYGGGHQEVKVVVGSMKTDQSTEKLVYELFKQVLA